MPRQQSSRGAGQATLLSLPPELLELVLADSGTAEK